MRFIGNRSLTGACPFGNKQLCLQPSRDKETDNANGDLLGGWVISTKQLFVFVAVVIGICNPCKDPIPVKGDEGIHNPPQIRDSARLDIVIFKL